MEVGNKQILKGMLVVGVYIGVCDHIKINIVMKARSSGIRIAVSFTAAL